jgi:hypothetical protein
VSSSLGVIQDTLDLVNFRADQGEDFIFYPNEDGEPVTWTEPEGFGMPAEETIDLTGVVPVKPEDTPLKGLSREMYESFPSDEDTEDDPTEETPFIRQLQADIKDDLLEIGNLFDEHGLRKKADAADLALKIISSISKRSAWAQSEKEVLIDWTNRLEFDILKSKNYNELIASLEEWGQEFTNVAKRMRSKNI